MDLVLVIVCGGASTHRGFKKSYDFIFLEFV